MWRKKVKIQIWNFKLFTETIDRIEKGIDLVGPQRAKNQADKGLKDIA